MNKGIKKICLVALAAVMLVGVLTGCGGGGKSDKLYDETGFQITNNEFLEAYKTFMEENSNHSISYEATDNGSYAFYINSNKANSLMTFYQGDNSSMDEKAQTIMLMCDFSSETELTNSSFLMGSLLPCLTRTLKQSRILKNYWLN